MCKHMFEIKSESNEIIRDFLLKGDVSKNSELIEAIRAYRGELSQTAQKVPSFI